MEKRLDYLDYAKGIAIILVVLGHIYKDGPVYIWLYSFHLPIFFIISGIIVKMKEDKNSEVFGKFIVKKAKTLLLPYITFALINFIFNVLWEMLGNGLTNNFIITELKNIVVLCARGAVWFLPCLFIAEALFFILRKVDNKIIINIMIFTLFIVGITVYTSGNSVSLVILRSFIALGYLNIGYYLLNVINNINSILILLLTLIASTLLSQLNGFVDLYSLTFNNQLLYVVNGVAGSLFILLICKRIKLNLKFLKYIGANSLIIMGTHLMPIKIL